MQTKDLEKILKDKLIKDGVNKEWMEKHVLIDTITKEDIEELTKELTKGEKNE